MRVFVVGPAGSGTSWISTVISNHPEVEQVVHLSYPTNDGVHTVGAQVGKIIWAPPGGLHWPNLKDHADPTDAVIVCCRDASCVRASNVTRGFLDATRGDLSAEPEVAISKITEQLEGWRGPVFLCSYETLVQWGDPYCAQMQAAIGLKPMPLDLHQKDANAKYIVRSTEPETVELLPKVWDIPEKPTIALVLSEPRLGFSLQAKCLRRVVQELRPDFDISSQGFPWESELTAGIEAAVESGADYVMFADYDGVYSADDARELLRIMQENPHLAAVYPVQAHRHKEKTLVSQLGVDYTGPLSITDCGHFGLTFIRRQVFEMLPKPWFWSIPDPTTYSWDEGNVKHADIFFWDLLKEHGGLVAQANNVVIGHLELGIKWPLQDAMAFQTVSNYMKSGRPTGVCMTVPPHAPVDKNFTDLEAGFEWLDQSLVGPQCGEYGAIRDLVRQAGLEPGKAVEFGTGNFFMLTSLVMNGWHLHAYDSDDKVVSRTPAEKMTVTPENVNDLPECEVMVIDVDGMDYHIWAAYEGRPAVVCIEHRDKICPVPMDDVPDRSVCGSVVDGGFKVQASADALNNLAISKGYQRVLSTRINSIFLRDDLVERCVKPAASEIVEA